MLLHSLLYLPKPSPSSPTNNLNSNSSLSSSALPPHPPLLLRFRTSHRENLRYLQTLKIIDPNTKPHKTPSPDSLEQIISIVNFLKSKGISDADFPRLAFLCPDLFSSDFDPTDIEPVFEFLSTDLSASVEESRGLIVKCPGILLSDVEFCLRPTLSYLQGFGIERLNMPTTLNAHLLNTRVEKLAEKVRFLKKAGFSKDEAARFCARFPAVFGYSVENNLRPKLECLLWVMKRSVEELKEFPQYFAFSLEKRIMPRHLHLVQRNVNVSLRRMLLWGDEKFYAKWK